METVKLTIDGREVQVPKNSTILAAARAAGIEIPTLCYNEDLDVKGMCRVCVVEVEGSRTLQTACSQPVSDGMVVHTNSARVRQARRVNVELLLSNHPQDCLSCIRNQRCELQTLADQLGVRELRFPTGSGRKRKISPPRPWCGIRPNVSSAGVVWKFATRCRG